MKVTRYTQSCLLIEDGDARLLIDPSAHENERVDELEALDAILYTHQHGDHFDAELAEKLRQGGAMIYANAATAAQMATAPQVVSDGDEFEVKGLSVKAIELPHCLMVDGSEGPQNTGYLLGGKFFHPGDGKELADLTVENLALPITGPDISLKDANDFAKQVSAKNAVLIHYDLLGMRPQTMENAAKSAGYKVTILELGESTEL